MNRIRRLPPVFWIGLLPVVILLWAWADSLSYISAWCYCGDPENRRTISCGESAIYLEHMVMAKRDPGDITGISLIETGGDWTRVPVDASSFLFPAYSRLSKSDTLDSAFTGKGTIHTTAMTLPFWLLLLGYLPLWLPLAWWQARRRRRKRAAELADIGEPGVEGGLA